MIIGCFSYLIENNKLIEGKFINNYTSLIVDRVTETKKNILTNSIDGSYDENWIENEERVNAKLSIKKDGEIYTLIWKGLFEGKGYIHNGMLVGFYYN